MGSSNVEQASRLSPIGPAAARARDGRETLIATLIALAVVGVTQLPYTLGELRRPAGTFFIGYPYPLDTNKYLGQMLQGARHGVLWYRNHLTTEEHAPAPLFHFYLALGKLAAMARLDPLAAFQLARVVFGVALILYLHRASRRFFAAPHERLGFLALVCFSSGFGSVSEQNTFRSIALFPHFSASCLLLAAYYMNLIDLCAARGAATSWRASASAVLCVLLTGVVHPWNLAAMGAGAVAFVIAARARNECAMAPPQRAGLAAIALAAGAIAAMHLHTLRANPVFAAIAAQNVTPLRGWREVIDSFGLLWLTAVGGAILALRDWRRSPFVYPALWLAVTGALMAFPYAFQRRLFEGLHIAVSLLTASFLYWIAGRIAARANGAVTRPRAAIGAVAITLALTVHANVAFLRFPYFGERPSAVYYPPLELLEAAQWLDQNAPENVNVMAAVGSGQLLCRFTLVNCFAVHSVETVDFPHKRRQAEWFFSGAGDEAELRRFLQDADIDYVFYGPWEWMEGRFRPLQYKWLEPVFRNASVAIFRFEKEAGA